MSSREAEGPFLTPIKSVEGELVEGEVGMDYQLYVP